MIGEKMNIAVILAGGSGNRVGAAIPKQFIDVLGKPILAYTLEAFEEHSLIDAVLVVCIKPYIDYVWKMKDKYQLTKLSWITEGGDTFQASVLNGIKFLENKIEKEDIVLVHFGASPFVSNEIITDAIRVCEKKGNAISATDYYVLSGEKKKKTSVSDPENFSEEYIDRETIAVMNSPHAFKFGYISDLYNRAIKSGIIETVEPHTTTLMYAMGEKIYFSYGNQSNIKITRKEDIALFEGYLLEKQGKNQEQINGDVVVFLADGFEECEGLIVVDILRRAEVSVVMASITGRRNVVSSRGITITADCLAEKVNYRSVGLIVLPGGRKGTETLRKSELVKENCRQFAKNKKLAAICAAPSILAELELMKKATVHPDYKERMGSVSVLDEEVVIDGNVITGKGLGATIPFSLELVKLLKNEDKVERIKTAICYRQ